MSRISSTFQMLKRKNRKALIPFITAGDPALSVTLEIMQTLTGHGADLIELGVPFSDPMADGPVIQQANERALQQGTSLADVLATVRRFRQEDEGTPVILMGYLTPIETFGYEKFAREAALAGVDGALIVDMPPEEAVSLNRCLRTVQIDQIFLVTPTTGAERIDMIAGMASGFLYYVSVKGTTGGKQAEPGQVGEKLRLITSKTELPIAVGFGIRDAETAARIAGSCDAVVIGSALVERIHAAEIAGDDVLADIGDYLVPVRYALDQAA